MGWDRRLVDMHTLTMRPVSLLFPVTSPHLIVSFDETYLNSLFPHRIARRNAMPHQYHRKVSLVHKYKDIRQLRMEMRILARGARAASCSP